MSCSCVVSLDKNFDSFHSEQVHVWVPATHHTAGGNPVREGKGGVGEGGSNAAIYQYTLVFHATETEISFPPCRLR